MRNLFLMLLLCATAQTSGFSQDSTWHYAAEVSGSLATGQTPFLMHANTYGVIPTNGSYALARASFHKVYNRHNTRFFQWSGGVEFVASADRTSDIFLTDLFIAGKVGPVEISIGPRKETFGLGDSVLTSGFVAMSANARPYPKIQISTPNFVSLIPRNDIISFKFSYSDGLLGPARIIYGNTDSIPEAYLHHKSIYVKLGKRTHKLNLLAGFNHQAMWGGEDEIFGGGLKRSEAYEYVVLGKPWKSSRVGNHFGTIDVGIEWKGKKWTTFLYRQSIYEDGSIANIANIADGLNGLRFKRQNVSSEGFKLNTILFEYLYTKQQGGNVFDFNTGTFGRDNYFNHYVFSQGWSYRGRTLGTPTIAPQHLIRENLRGSQNLFTVNNRLVMFHSGIDGSINKVKFLLKGSHSVNYGTYNRPFRTTPSQTSLLAQVALPVGRKSGSLLQATIGTDFGQYYPNSTAIMIGWRKSGFIR